MHQAALSTNRNMLTDPADQALTTPVTTPTHAEFNYAACSLTPSSFVSYNEDEEEDMSWPDRASWRARPSVLFRSLSDFRNAELDGLFSDASSQKACSSTCSSSHSSCTPLNDEPLSTQTSGSRLIAKQLHALKADREGHKIERQTNSKSSCSKYSPHYQ